jgi:hypothetical protein
MLGFLRPDAWELPLFLHVLGAVVLFGAVGSVLVLAAASLRRDARAAPLLRRIAFKTMLIAVWPSFILMRLTAEWIRSKEFPSGAQEPDWIGVGYVVGDGGVVVLLGLTLCAWLATRQKNADRARPATATIATGIAGFYLVALAVAWFAMSAKPGS